MRARVPCRLWLLVLCGFSFLIAETWAAPPVQGRLQKSLVGLGETVSLEIVVEGTADARVSADMPTVAGLRITGPQTSSMSQTSIINGRVESTVTTTLTYQITATKEGTFVIPAFSVSVDGKTSSVGPFRLKAERSPESNQIKLRASLEKARVFVQEPVTYHVAWYIATDVKDYLFTIPVLDDTPDMKVEILTPEASKKQGELVANSTRLRASIETATLDGVEYAVYNVKLQLYPLRHGTVSIPSPFVRAAVRDGWKVERDFFGFTNRVPKYKTLSTAAEEIVLHVKPLPVEGRPRGFTGAVGDYAFSIAADVEDVRVGDPIRLTMTVRGDGLLDQIPRIDLAEFPDVEQDFSVVETLEPGEVLDDRVVFEQVVRARRATVEVFPAVSFSYFDTRTGKYRNAWSNALPLNVDPAPGLGPLEEFGATAEVGRTPAETSEGLRGLHRGDELQKLLSNPWTPLVWLTMAPGCYFLLLCAVIIRRRLSGESQVWKRRSAILGMNKAFVRIGKLIGEPGDVFFSELAKTCKEQISTRLGIGIGEVTVHDIPKLVQSGILSQKTGEELVRFLEDLDVLRFSREAGEPSSRGVLLQRAREIIPRVKKR